jgi:gliding motility-associated-like protein
VKLLCHPTVHVLLLLGCILDINAQPFRVHTAERPLPRYTTPWQNTNPAPDNAVNDCITWTFRTRYKHAGNSQSLIDMIAVPGAGFVFAGNDQAGASGFVTRIDEQGGIMWSKRISLSQKIITVKQVKLFSSGRFYIIGDATDIVTNISQPFIATFDGSGVLQWTKLVSVPTVAGSWRAAFMDEWRDNSFTLAISNNSMINISRLQIDGTIMWSRTYNTVNTPTIVGLRNEIEDIYLAYNETDAGFKKGAMLNLDLIGNLRFAWKLGGTDGEYTLQRMEIINYVPHVMAAQTQGGATILTRIGFSPLGQPATKMVYNIMPAVTNNLIATQFEIGDAIAAANNFSNDVYIALTPGNSSTAQPTRGWHIPYPYPVQLTRINRAYDGGMLIGGTAWDGTNDIVLTKTDSVANLPVCGSNEIPASFSVATPLGIQVILDQQTDAISLSDAVFTLGDHLLTPVDECRNLYCPTVPEPDECLRTFSKIYRDNSGSMWMERVTKINNNLLMTGSIRPVPGNIATDRPALALVDTMGNMLDARIWNAPQQTVFTRTITLRDGNLLSVGHIQHRFDSMEQVVIKYTPQLDIIWQRKMNAPGMYRRVLDVVESQENELFCYLEDRSHNPAHERRYLLKLSAAGDPVWFRAYDTGPNVFVGTAERNGVLTELGNFIYLKYNDEATDSNPYITKISKADGFVAWVRRYVFPVISINNQFDPIRILANGNHIYLFGGADNQGTVLLKVAEDGAVAACKYINTGPVVNGVAVKENGFLLSATANTWNSPRYGVFELDSDFNLGRRQFIQVTGNGGIYDVSPFSDSISYSAAVFYTYNGPFWGSFSLQKFNFNVPFGSCEVTDFPIEIRDYSTTVSVRSTVVESLPLPSSIITNNSLIPVPTAYSSSVCGNQPVCNILTITGPAMLCDSTIEYTYQAHRNTGCNAKVIWNIDTIPGRVRVTNLTETTIRFKILASGPIRVRAKMFGNCDWVADTLPVTISISPSTPLDLGPDTTICPGNTIALSAQEGYSSYLWQDGSTGRTFMVTAPGIYYVDVVNCGNTVRDSVVVADFGAIPLNIGPDRTTCNNDTVHLHAPAGFINYAWSPNYNINTTNTQSVVVQPSIDTVYTVIAEKTPGCFAYDTIRISVASSPVVDLGTDRAFCPGDSSLLDAGNGFVSYSWSNSNNAQQQYVHTSGQYSFIGTTAEGCNSYDTVLVNVFALPPITLDPDPTICTGDTRVLDAGAGFSSYLWNNGHTGRSITVNATGLYAVAVIDNNGCEAADTTTITTILPLPVGFLAADTAICQYGKVELIPVGSFNQYLWSNGGTTTSIFVSQPGEYSLRVKNDNGCVGKDTIVVRPKECLKGLYVPKGFTPNGDGKNDVLRPLLFGDIKQYRFYVYNRWGQLIFQSTTPGIGWSGMLSGVKVDSGVFVWVCSYQLEGEAAKVEKGTFMLIR